MAEPLPIFQSQSIGEIRSKEGEVFDVRVGLDTSHVERIKQFSLDETDLELQKNTSDHKRFGEGSYEEWYSKERTPYALISAEGELAALAWFGPKPIGRKSLRYLSAEELKEEYSQEKTEWHTIVYRAYKPYRGRGLMTSFMRFAMEDYYKRHPDAKLWAGVGAQNPASIALAHKLGFQHSDAFSDPEEDWTAMIKEN